MLLYTVCCNINM